MKDFGRWLADFVLPAESANPDDTLPEGVWEREDGVYFATCVVCERDAEILCDLVDIPEVGYRHFCGGSPSCCP